MKKSVLYFSLILLVAFSSCNDENDSFDPNENSDTDSLVSFTIFYTNDEHGWFEEVNEYKGAAGLVGMWKNIEGYDGSDNYLILSGGDMWTGAAASTWFEGESMVQVMNAMEYDAAAIGNHEFDFKVEALNQRLGEMSFPLLAANIREKSTGNIPSFAQAYIIKNIDGVQIGIIGLASTTTPYSTFPANVVDYEFTAYADAINTYAPEVKNEGADVIILIGHMCQGDMLNIVDVAKANGISVIGGGHCNQIITLNEDGVALIGAWDKMQGYAKVEFNYNVTKDLTQDFDINFVYNNQSYIDDDVKTIIDFWLAKTDEALSDIIGYTSVDIPRYSVEIQNLMCDSWLYRFPNADMSISNAGGIRQDVFSGDINLADIVSMLPFENYIVELELTGAEVKDVINGLIIGGMTAVDGYYLSDGTPIDDQQVYTVLTTDYLYSQTSINFSTYDPDPYNTNEHYRQPLIDWLKSLNTSSTDPLENYLDYTSRW